MALDGLVIHSIVDELHKKLLGGKIDKVYQPENDEVVLHIRNNKENFKLVLSCSASNPRVYLASDYKKENPINAPMFCMLFRKYIQGGNIVNVSQVDFERIIKISVESFDELKEKTTKDIIIEIMGRHSNITLVRERDNKIMECIKHISPSINSYRVLYPGIAYKLPPKSTKINPFTFNNTTLTQFLHENPIIFDKNFFTSCFTGISKPLSEHLFIEYNKQYTDFSASNIRNFINNFLNTLLDNETFKIYKDKNDDYVDFYVIPLVQLEEEFSSEVLEDIHELMDKYYLEKDKQERIKGRSVNLQKLVTTNIDRCIKKENKLNDLLKKCEDKDDFKIKGDLLTSYIYSIKKGDKDLNISKDTILKILEDK